MNFSDLEKKLETQFRDQKLLREALTHRSYLNEHQETGLHSNERLEFLGDAILEFVVSRLLFKRFPNSPEGFLTACRSQVVQTKTLSSLAQNIKLGDFLFLSKGEEESGGRRNSGLLENAFEALIGAIFLDQGIEKTTQFIKGQFSPVLDALSPEKLKDAKSFLQEKTQEKEKMTPTYRVLEEIGPDHAKVFTVAVYLDKRELAQGKGYSKQEAEEKAAQAALEKNYQKD